MAIRLSRERKLYLVLIVGAIVFMILGALTREKTPEKTGAATKPSSSRCPGELTSLLESSAKIYPHVEDAILKGWVIREIAPSSPWLRFGLQNTDQITRISGDEIKSPAEFTLAMGGFCDNNFSMEIKRRGQTMLVRQKLSAADYLKP